MFHYELAYDFIYGRLSQKDIDHIKNVYDKSSDIVSAWEHLANEGLRKSVSIMDSFSMAVNLEFLQRMQKRLGTFVSFCQLSESIEFRAVHDALCAEYPEQLIVLNFMTLFYINAHMKTGCHNYQVSDGLAIKLRNTELRGLTCDELRLPYEAIFIVVPKAASLKCYNTETNFHDVEAIYVVEDRDYKGNRSWRIMIVGHDKGMEENSASSKEMRQLHGRLDRHPYYRNDAVVFFRLELPAGDLVSDALSVAHAQYTEEKARATWGKQIDLWQPLFSWVMNVVLYATHTEPGKHWIVDKQARQLWERAQKKPKGSKARKKVLDQYSKSRKTAVKLLGQHITIDRQLYQLTEKSQGQGKPLNVRFRVEGHWRKQRYGKGLKEVKTIWIEPFWKGPTDGVEVAPSHILKG
jgi:hypothetical protein